MARTEFTPSTTRSQGPPIFVATLFKIFKIDMGRIAGIGQNGESQTGVIHRVRFQNHPTEIVMIPRNQFRIMGKVTLKIGQQSKQTRSGSFRSARDFLITMSGATVGRVDSAPSRPQFLLCGSSFLKFAPAKASSLLSCVKHADFITV